MPAATNAGTSASADVRIDRYIADAQPFAQPILTHLRAVVHEAVPDVEEAVKWSMPFFVCRGVILANMAGFKAHCTFRVWQAGMETDRPPSGALGAFDRVTTLEELPPKRELKALLTRAAERVMSGERTKNWEGRAKKAGAIELPEALDAALKANKNAASNFKAMSPSAQREYCEWVGEAKRDETRAKRVAAAMEWISEGKPRHWKYQNC